MPWTSTKTSGVLQNFGRLCRPTVAFGAVLIAATWLFVDLRVKSHAENVLLEQIADVSNYGLMFEQDVLRSASDIDRTIKYLRHGFESSDFNADWATLIKSDFASNSRTVQIAVIGHNGMMIASTAQQRPDKPIDLSDREHFQFHVNKVDDNLFIGPPVLGRASGKWSVQFTRRFTLKDGRFGGVIVVSLDPSVLMATYAKLHSQTGWGFALIGADHVVRSGAGFYASMIGKQVSVRSEGSSLRTRFDDEVTTREHVDDRWRVVSSRKVGSLPLAVLVSVEDSGAAAREIYGINFDYVAATVFSALVGLILVSSALRENRDLARITMLAHRDTLTGLRNRLSFQNRLLQEFALLPSARSFAVHLLDLDRFKLINDTHGHLIGDQLLIHVAERLKVSTRPSDVVFRLGGDEFALVQAGCHSQEQAAAVAQRVCSILGEPFEIDGHHILTGASVGIALGRTDGHDIKELLQAADMALYLAKEEGRGTFRHFNMKLNAAHARRRQTVADLSVAAERGEFVLHYQPKLSLLPVRQISGYEALVRWQHPVRGMISPIDFIGLAEETGLIVSIGEWVLKQACLELAAQPGHVTVAVNCSPVQFTRSNVVAAVKDALTISGLPACRLEIEITETALMGHDSTVLLQLQELRNLGVRIALDDFGTGYSSLSYLHTYPIDCIKIDRSFVKTLGENGSAGPIVRAIVTLAKQLEKTTVAEGVETQLQLDELLAAGCNQVQGFLFGHPQAATDIWPVVGDAEQLRRVG
jgi:diguanylate cyclase (GGDEF)-like protein